VRAFFGLPNAPSCATDCFNETHSGLSGSPSRQLIYSRDGTPPL